jgi:hypothetical protein
MICLDIHTCNLGHQTREAINPFTDEKLNIPIDLGLTSKEQMAVREFLAESGASPPDSDSFCRVMLLGGDSVIVDVGSLYTDVPCRGFAAEYSVLTLEVASFLFELARRGNMTIGSSVNPTLVALTSREQPEQVKVRWPHASFVESPEGLEAWLRMNTR